tara:strand:- start:133736 stop:133960 length:225 start_codon:yes stop_codon:yes gene_type:complete
MKRKKESALPKKKKEGLNIFICETHNAVMVAYNRGQAVQLLGKKLKKEGKVLERTDPVVEVDSTKPTVITWGED